MNGSDMGRVAELAHRVPHGALEAVCRELERAAAGVVAARAVGDGVVAPDARALVQAAVDDWIARRGQAALGELAWALRGATAADEAWRRSQDLALVWTGPAPATGTLLQTEQALLRAIRSAERELWLVSFAGYRLPSVRDALLAAAGRGVQVNFLIESPEESEGKVTFSALRGLGVELARSVTVWVWPLEKRPRESGKHGTLHVKCVLADRNLLFVTSANLTDFAMSLNMELGIILRQDDLAGAFARHLSWLATEGVIRQAPKA